MDYNKFTYYRANPYAKQGFMPPTAYVNRHIPQFLTELPMGQQHLNKIGRKQYYNNANKSNIQADDLLKSPQRYPYENRIAFDKQYQRNLNTIDIEGASGGTLLSQALRNKMKARQILTRKQQLQNIGESQASKMAELNEQQKRRKIAYTQFMRDQKAKQRQSTQKLTKNRQNDNNCRQLIPKTKFHQMQQSKQNYFEKNNFGNQQNFNNNQHLYPRYQSIDISKLRQKSQKEQQQNIQRNSKQYLKNGNLKILESHRRYKHNIDNQDLTEHNNQKIHNYSNQNPNNIYHLNLAKDKKTLRYQNPTNLSTDSSIHLAARNIIKGE